MDLVPLLLVYLLPLGLILVAWGTWDQARVRDQAVTALLVIAVAILSYAAIGFALQFGGIGLRPDVPAGLHGLDRMWSPVSNTTGSWGVVVGGLKRLVMSVAVEVASANLSWKTFTAETPATRLSRTRTISTIRRTLAQVSVTIARQRSG